MIIPLQWRRLQWWQMTRIAMIGCLIAGLALLSVAFLFSVSPGFGGRLSGWFALSVCPLGIVLIIGIYSRLQHRADLQHGRTESQVDHGG